MMNCRKTKKSHRKARGIRAVLSFFMTINFINAPATKTAIKLFMGQASGRTTISITPSVSVRKIDSPMMRTVLLRNIVKMSIKYRPEHPRANSITSQNVTSSESSK